MLAEGQEGHLVAYTAAFLIFRVGSPFCFLPSIFFGVVARKQSTGRIGLGAGMLVLLAYLISWGVDTA
jgi:hypothetical protein